MKSFITAICVWLALTVGAYANHETRCLPEVDMKANLELTEKRQGQYPFRMFKEKHAFATSYYMYTPKLPALYRDNKYWVLRYDFTPDTGCLILTPKGSLYWYVALTDDLKDRMMNKMELFHEFNWTYDEDFPAYGQDAGFTKEGFQKIFHTTEKGCQTVDIFMQNIIPTLKLYYPTTDLRIYYDEEAGKLVVIENGETQITVVEIVDGCIHDSNIVELNESHMQYMNDDTLIYVNLGN